jgi:YbgC/YbaW family acyl-CoA thioester hydrolase
MNPAASPVSPRSEYILRRRVHFYETDTAGIVHFSNYFRYMEEAEHALWRDVGLTIAKRSGVGFPRIAASFEYHRPLRVEDEFDIRIRVVAKSEKTMRYECVLLRGEERIATGSLTIVGVSAVQGQPMKSIPFPPEIGDRFAVAPAQ